MEHTITTPLPGTFYRRPSPGADPYVSEGDEVKFYAVKAGRLFWPYYPKESEGYPFHEKALKRLAEHAAETLDVVIYGGDAIISPEGKITLIDFNDWPSFAPCRGTAASCPVRIPSSAS